MNRPNILWICSDQQRFDTLGSYGNPFVRTPAIDGLAERGVLFERAYVQSTVCTPSRASFLTGRYPCTTRCRMNGQSIPADEILVTRLLAEAGYTCGLSGKLHLSACHPKACPTTERRIDDGYTEFHWSHHPAPDWPENEYIHWLSGEGVEYGRSPFRGSEYVHAGMPAEHHQTTWCAEKAVNFIRARASSGEPWLFSVNFFDPHPPFDPPEEHLERYLDALDDIPLPNYAPGELEKKPAFQKSALTLAHERSGGYPALRMTDGEHRLLRAAYWAMIDLIDAQVGRMLEALEETGQSESTLVIFMSDHGEMLGDHGRYRKGPFFYEPAVRVPLVLSWPGVVTPRRVGGLVELVDLAPTLLDAARLARHAGMQGRSLWPVLTGRADAGAHRTDVYCEYYAAFHGAEEGRPHATMLRTERHKAVVYHGTDEGELYDLERDAAETHNLWDDAEYGAAKLELLKRLCDRMAWTVDPLPPRESAW